MPQADSALSTLDPFALGGYAPEPTPAQLWAQYKELDQRIDALEEEGDRDAADLLLSRQVEIEDEIASHVAPDAASVLAQVELLAQYSRDFDWSDWSEKIFSQIIAGLRRMEKASAPATPPADHSDIALIAAEQEMTALRTKQQALWAAGQDADELHDPIGRKVGELGRLISTTEPATLVGAKIKLRYLADPEIGIAGGSCPQGTDEISVQQLYALVERLIANS